MTSALARPPYISTGYQMINEIEIRNFKCFEHLPIQDCRRVNVIVGDNGTGKTAFLEALFLALGASTEIAARYRQMRGLDGTFSGSAKRIEEALWRDFFFKQEWERSIYIEAKGTGVESRSVTISRGASELFMPLSGDLKGEEILSAPIKFVWRDHKNNQHVVFPKVGPTGIQLEGTNEDLPDFFYFAANQTLSSLENAGRFSELSRSGGLRQFIDVFVKEYKWVQDLGIEVLAGAPVIYATLGGDIRLPLTNVSGGINRVVGIMLAIASHPKSVVLVDEMEDGVYYKHHAVLWRSMLNFTRQYDSQLFVTTHNEEWLTGLVEAAGKNVEDISLWRLEREKDKILLRQFNGRKAISGISAGEVR